MNPIEGLWKWMREEVTQHRCHDALRDLFDACKGFVGEINRDALAVVQRLCPDSNSIRKSKNSGYQAERGLVPSTSQLGRKRLSVVPLPRSPSSPINS